MGPVEMGAAAANIAASASTELAATATGVALEAGAEAALQGSVNASAEAASTMVDVTASAYVDKALMSGDPVKALQNVAAMPDIQATLLNPNDILNGTSMGTPDFSQTNPSISADTVDPGLKTDGATDVPAETSNASERSTADPETLEDYFNEYDAQDGADIQSTDASQNPGSISNVTEQASSEVRQIELAERDELQSLRAADPSYLNEQGQARLQQLSKKYDANQAAISEQLKEPIIEAQQEKQSQTVSQDLQDPGDFDEDAVRQELDTDKQRSNWTEEQKQAYINEKRGEHDQKKSEYEAQKTEKEGEQEKTTADKKAQLDQELKQTQEDLVEGKITPQQANERLKRNERARRNLVNGLVEQLKAGKDLTPFEQEVAEKAMRMQELMLEIQVAPKILVAMENTINKMKAQYKEAAQFQITPQNADTPEARKNIAIRSGLANQIASQAAHMAKYSDIVSVNVNEFRSVNSSLMSLIGVRDGFVNMLVQIDTGIRRKVKGYVNDAKARQIAARA